MNGIVELLEQAPEERIRIEYLFLSESVTKTKEDEELRKKLQLLARKNKIKTAYLKQGDRIKDGSMEFVCLHPGNNPNRSFSTEDRNNQSLVLWLRYYDFDMLLTGDVEKDGEQEILKNMELIGIEENWSRQEENRISLKQGEGRKLTCGSGFEVL